MTDPVDRWRSSLNVQRAPAEALRRNWLTEAAMAPDEYRASWGLSPLSPATRDAVMPIYGSEAPDYGATDYYGHGRPVQLEEPDVGLPPLGVASQPSLSFMRRSDDAMLGQDVARMLAHGSEADPTTAAIQGAMTRLGYR